MMSNSIYANQGLRKGTSFGLVLMTIVGLVLVTTVGLIGPISHVMADAGEITVIASDDAYVKEENPNTNFSNDPAINLKYASGDRRYAFLKFNVTGLAGKNVTSVKLQLTEHNSASEGDTQFQVKNIASGTWSESTVTWNNKPSAGTTVYGSYAGGMLANRQFLNIPLHNFIMIENGTYQLALIATSTSSNDSVFESKECADGLFKPKLIITYTAPMTVITSEDAYVRQDSPNTNYSSDASISLKYGASEARYSYLKFKVAGLADKNVTSVKLQLTEHNSASEGDTQFQVKNIASGTWSESAVTWNNKPTAGSTIYGSYTGGALSNRQVLEIPLDGLTMAQDGTYQLALITTSTPSNDSSFESRENTNGLYKPKLIITYVPKFKKLLFMDSDDIENPVGKLKFVSNGLDTDKEDVPKPSGMMDPLTNVLNSDGSWTAYGMSWTSPAEETHAARPSEEYIQVKSTTTDGDTYTGTSTRAWDVDGPLDDIAFLQKSMAYNANLNEWLLLYSALPNEGDGFPFYAYKSTDGLHFTPVSEDPVYYGHDAFHLMWDPISGDYICYQVVFQPWDTKYDDHAGNSRRIVAIKRSSDGITWTGPQHNVLQTGEINTEELLIPDANDPEDMQFYWFTVFPYADRYIGMMLLYEPSPPEVNSRNLGVPNSHGPMLATEWMISRDGVNWSRPYQDQYLGLEPDATGLYANREVGILQSNPIIEAGELHFPGRGALAEDRIGGVASAPNSEFSTHAFTMPSTGLKLNATSKFLGSNDAFGQNRQGYIMVELLDEQGQVISGYEKENCYFRDVDGSNLSLTWDSNDGTELAGQQVKLRFYIRSARVYAVTT